MTISKEKIMELAKDTGFEYFGVLDASKLRFRSEVRDMCAAGRCKAYGHNWACPPACGTIEEAAENAAKYKYGIIVQSVGQMEDDFDVETMQETERVQKERFEKMVDKLRDDGVDVLPMSAGTCTKCKTCAYPDPCRMPDRRLSSMEAYGLVVSDSCTLAGVDYYHGPQTMAFTCCILFNE